MALTASQVELLYVAFYNRPADPAGLAYWESSSATYGQAANYFGASPEYTAMFTGLTNTQVVAQVYENMFNRLPDPAGLIYWSNLLTAGTLTLGSIALAIAGGAQGTDATILANKVTAATDFTNNIVTTPEILAYSGAAANHQASLWLDTVGSSPSSLTGALGTEAGVIAALIAPVIGTTSTLTTGIDTFAGAAGNAIFNSLNTTAGGATLNALDSLTGTGTNNAFNISDNSSTSIFAGNLANSVSVSGIQTVNINELNAVGNSAQNDFSGWTGLTALNINASTGTDSVKAAATTNVKVVDSAGAVTVAGGNADTITTTSGNVVVTTPISATVTTTAGSVSVTGATGAVTATDTAVATTGSASSATDAIYVAAGSNVTVTATGLTQTSTYTSGTVTIGSSTSAITGTVSVTTGESLADRTAQGAITVNGGTTVTVTENANNAVNTTATLGAVTINGGANTTSATVTQATAATAASAVVGVGNGTDKVVDAQYAASTTAGKNGLGTITSVAFTGLGGTSNEIDDSNLQSLTVNNSPASTTVAVKEGALTSGITAATTLTLSLSNNAGLTVSDQNKYTTLNVVTGTTGSTLTVVGTTNNSVITTENISGSSVLTQTAATSSTGMLALTAISVTGGAGLTDTDLSSITTLTSVNGSGTTGALTLTVDPTVTTITGGVGNDVITVAKVATKAINGGTGANEIVYNGSTALTAGLGTISNFQTLGVGATYAATSGAFNLSNFSGITGLDILGNTGNTGAAIAFTNATSGTSLSIDGSVHNATPDSISFTAADSQGVYDSLALTLGTATTQGITVDALTVQDAITTGFGTLSISSNGDTTARTNVISSLTDTYLSSLTITGKANLTINGTVSDSAATFTLNATGTGATGVTIAALSDNSLTGLTSSGSEAVIFTHLANTSSGSTSSMTVRNTGSGALTITHLDNVSSDTSAINTITFTESGTSTITVTTAFADSSLATLNLNGNVALSVGASSSNTGVATGITVTGSTDNSVAALYLTGAGSGYTDNVSLGNGGDTIVIGTGGGTSNITLGTGANIVTLAHGAKGSLTFGSHTGVDTVILSTLVGDANYTNTSAVIPSVLLASGTEVISGLATGDKISLYATVHQTNTDVTSNTSATINQGVSLAAVANKITEVHGSYSNGTFTYGATGADSLVMYDVGVTDTTGVYTAIVLVGYHGTLGTLSSGVSTLG